MMRNAGAVAVVGELVGMMVMVSGKRGSAQVGAIDRGSAEDVCGRVWRGGLGAEDGAEGQKPQHRAPDRPDVRGRVPPGLLPENLR